MMWWHVFLQISFICIHHVELQSCKKNNYVQLETSNVAAYISRCDVISRDVKANAAYCGLMCLKRHSKCPVFVVDADTCLLCKPRNVIKANVKKHKGITKCGMQLFSKKGKFVQCL